MKARNRVAVIASLAFAAALLPALSGHANHYLISDPPQRSTYQKLAALPDVGPDGDHCIRSVLWRFLCPSVPRRLFEDR